VSPAGATGPIGGFHLWWTPPGACGAAVAGSVETMFERRHLHTVHVDLASVCAEPGAGHVGLEVGQGVAQVPRVRPGWCHGPRHCRAPHSTLTLLGPRSQVERVTACGCPWPLARLIVARSSSVPVGPSPSRRSAIRSSMCGTRSSVDRAGRRCWDRGSGRTASASGPRSARRPNPKAAAWRQPLAGGIPVRS